MAELWKISSKVYQSIPPWLWAELTLPLRWGLCVKRRVESSNSYLFHTLGNSGTKKQETILPPLLINANQDMTLLEATQSPIISNEVEDFKDDSQKGKPYFTRVKIEADKGP